ncbi:type II secretion system GspH family protein [Puniceicoccaceae bacterium]|nr:type II secretion system GspH family protein [Puniceicoccaceae bacterium]
MNIKRSAFTLIELLSVIAVIGVLAAILIPVVGKVRKSSYDATCTSNLRQVSAAYLLMMGDNKNILIPAIQGEGSGTSLNSKWYKPKDDGPKAAWSIPLASFMQEGKQWNRLNDLNCPEALAAIGKASERSSYGFNHFVGKTNASNGSFRGAVRMEQLSSPSQTIMFGDTRKETDIRTVQNLDHTTIYAWHGDYAKVSYFDGSVSSITVEEAQAKPPNSDEGYLFWRGVERR